MPVKLIFKIVCKIKRLQQSIFHADFITSQVFSPRHTMLKQNNISEIRISGAYNDATFSDSGYLRSDQVSFMRMNSVERIRTRSAHRDLCSEGNLTVLNLYEIKRP